jgi:primosomal protein N' (replication factor Y)
MGNLTEYADVIMPLPVQSLYTYKVSDEQTGKIKPGCRVTVQFGRRKIYTALVRRIHNTKPGGYHIKNILSILDNVPLVNELQLKFWEWIAEYYMCSPGDVYKSALPSGLKSESETKVFPAPLTGQDMNLSEKELLLLDALRKRNVATIKEIESLAGKKDVMSLIRSLHDKGVIFLEERLIERYKPKLKTYVTLSHTISGKKKLNNIIEMLQKAPGQQKLFLGYLDLSDAGAKAGIKEIDKSLLLKSTCSSESALKSLVKKEILETHRKEVSRLTEVKRKQSKPSALNDYQEKALNNIENTFLKKDVALFHGVTSSGKTEIYIHLIDKMLKHNKQVLYLLPEIAITAQIINRLKNVFGEKVGVYHSKLSDSERVEIWKNITGQSLQHYGQYRVILGTRSSLFLPFDNLGLIIIDEEHENTYKQSDSAPRYHARDAAVMLAGFHGAKVLMGTATPSIESYYNAKTLKYGLVELKTRYLDLEMPEIKVVDIRKARLKKEMKSVFSPALLDSVKNALENREQVILFQNRRGFAAYIKCDTCGWIPFCKHCDVSMTYHKHMNRINCHYCGYTIKVPVSCAACGGRYISTQGFGTEKVEDEIPVFFPGARIKRMDLDSTRTKKSYERIIYDFEAGKIDILIGTQMITKGLDFNNVRVVGIINADSMLNYPDFRSYERSYQLMAQVSGRAGRKNERGIVIIQTSDPDNSIIQNVRKNDYQSMFDDQLAERRKFKYPPLYRLVELTLKHKKQHVLDEASGLLAGALRKRFGDRILGPESPVVHKIKDWYLKKILLKMEKDKSVKQSKKFVMDNISELLLKDEFRSLHVVADVDPL